MDTKGHFCASRERRFERFAQHAMDLVFDGLFKQLKMPETNQDFADRSECPQAHNLTDWDTISIC